MDFRVLGEDGERAICGARIDDNNAINRNGLGEDTVKTGADFGGFVFDGDEDGDGGHSVSGIRKGKS